MKKFLLPIALGMLLIGCSAPRAANTSVPAPIPQPNYLTREQAKEIALQYAGSNSSDIYDLEMDFDFNGNRAIYEVEWKEGKKEYEVDIDALTGTVYNFEVDGKDRF
ncbi:MAG: hypothetical protein BEN18_06665 [Epulopiscium sp. Nuni2H_MBin001]|nr:MAG: hypothetical protein BEN18_06665 [Epulopiscium sp. Nuni2H_MBin001]